MMTINSQILIYVNIGLIPQIRFIAMLNSLKFVCQTASDFEANTWWMIENSFIFSLKIINFDFNSMNNFYSTLDDYVKFKDRPQCGFESILDF